MIRRSITKPLSTQDRTTTMQTTNGHTSLPWAAFDPMVDRSRPVYALS